MKKFHILQKISGFAIRDSRFSAESRILNRESLLIYAILVIFVILVTPVAKADSSFQLKIDDVLNKKNIVITHPATQEKYLLYLGIGCGEMTKGQVVNLIVKGSLTGGDDAIKEDTEHQCLIQKADIFTNKIYVSTVFGDNSKAYVQDEKNNEYYISFGSNCASIIGYKNNYIYTFQAGLELSKSDKIIIPNNGGQCSIYYLEKTNQNKSEVQKNINDKVPTTVTDVKAFPKNGSVFLTWKSSKDDYGISYYIISYSHSALYTKDVGAGNMPNEIKVKSNHYIVSGLRNDLPYYFYVLAVDTGGNTSSNWSEGALAVPKSSIMPVNSSGGVTPAMNIRLAIENNSSFLIRWNPISGSKQTLKFEVDGKIAFVQYQYGKSYISISKNAEYKGKKLALTVKATDIKGNAKEEKINFDF